MKKYFSIIISTLLLTACSISKSTYSDAPKWIPADFDINKGAVLIENYPGKEKWNDAMEVFVAQNYPGKFVFVSQKEIESKVGKYSDLNKFRFIFKWSKKTTFRPRGDLSQVSRDVDWYGQIYDRTTDVLYPTTHRANSYGWKGYIPFINSIVKFSEKASKPSSVASK